MSEEGLAGQVVANGPLLPPLDQLIACHECGTVHRLPTMPDDTIAQCVSCGARIFIRFERSIELVQPALGAERRDGLRDVLRERRDERVPERLLDERAHDRDVVGLGRERVGGDHPPALGREL